MSVIMEYISNQRPDLQPVLLKVHQTILAVIPNAIEQIKYGMPTYYYHQNLIHFAANKNHLGIYPNPSAIIHFEDQLVKYHTSKGAIQFPYDQVDYDLISKITAFRKQEVELMFR